MQILLALLAGAALGGIVAWFILSSKMQTLKERTKNDLVADRASMVEQLRGKDQRIEELRQTIEERDCTLTTYQIQLTEATQEKAIAQTQLKAAQQQTTEKLALLTTAQQQFADTFKALSSEALKANNQSFLDLAQTRLSDSKPPPKAI